MANQAGYVLGFLETKLDGKIESGYLPGVLRDSMALAVEQNTVGRAFFQPLGRSGQAKDQAVDC
jgi:hypothetical protein